MSINANTTLAEINNEFHRHYPFLSLHFFIGHYHGYEFDQEIDEIDLHSSIGELSNSHLDNRMITLHYWQTTTDAESLIFQKLGIRTQIFRKHEDKWIQTVGSDGLTLEQQNELGAQSSKSSSSANMREKPI